MNSLDTALFVPQALSAFPALANRSACATSLYMIDQLLTPASLIDLSKVLRNTFPDRYSDIRLLLNGEPGYAHNSAGGRCPLIVCTHS